MSVHPPAPGRYQQHPHYPQHGRAFAQPGGFPQQSYGRPYAPIPPQVRPAGDPGLIPAVVGLVLFFVVALPIVVIGMAIDLNPTFYLPATMATVFLSTHAFCVSKRHGHTNVIAVITISLCLLLLLSGLASALIRLLLIL